MSSTQAAATIQSNHALARLTTIRLGGTAKYFKSCRSADDIRSALAWTGQHNVPVHILGGGSNTIFADRGYAGLVLHIALKGITFEADSDTTVVTAGAGERWDELVEQCVARGLAGLECLSGIPGLVGATPMQNVGAYGQEVANTITAVRAIDRTTLEDKTFTNEECHFEYRGSRFKYQDAGKYIITQVSYQLPNDGRPTATYPDIVKELGGPSTVRQLPSGRSGLRKVRQATLSVRRRKSMVIDKSDPHSQSCGSFFVNPILTNKQFADLKNRAGTAEIPSFPSGDNVKVPAAWLIEQAGFPRGYRVGAVGISPNHNLALVNYGGSTTELLRLASTITSRVDEKFGIALAQEPIVVEPAAK